MSILVRKYLESIIKQLNALPHSPGEISTWQGTPESACINIVDANDYCVVTHMKKDKKQRKTNCTHKKNCPTICLITLQLNTPNIRQD